MEQFEEKEGEFSGKNSRPYIRYLTFIAIIVVGLGASIALGFNYKSFFQETSALFAETFSDTVQRGGSRGISLEIPIENPEGTSEAEGKTTEGEEIERISGRDPQNSPRTVQEGGPLSPSPKETPSEEREETVSVAKGTQSTLDVVSKTQPSRVPDCDFDSGENPTRRAIFSEVAWMGSPPQNGETASQASNNEWVELANVSKTAISLSGWSILGRDEKIEILFDREEQLHPGAYYLLERTDDDSVRGIAAEKIYTGSLSNGGEWLRLFDDTCSLVDEVNATLGWPAGDNASKRTLERDEKGTLWYTSALPGGTPKAKNSEPASTQSFATSTSTAAGSSSLQKFGVSVSIQGSGSGTVASTPSGISCGFVCYREYDSGTSVTLSATPDSHSSFDGWSGVCSGRTFCTIVVSTTVSVSAIFTSTLPPPTGSSGPTQNPSQHTATSLLIAEVQIAGSLSNEDFIKIYNPGNTALDISGWQLKKRTSGTTESSVRQFPQGSIIPAAGYFMWANSQNGFSESVGAQTSSTQTLAATNSIALLDPSDAIVDALAWGSGHANPFVEGSPYPINPGANQLLKRKSAAGVLEDTNSNADDFEIQ